MDFDGTLAHEVPNRTDPYQLGEPVETMVNRVKDWVAKGYDVRIFTARMCPVSYSTGKLRDVNLMAETLQDWSEKYIGKRLPCTNIKDGLMEVLWDDRAVRVIENTGEYK